MDVPVTRLFWRNLRSTARIVINRGGARSSKSYSLGQLFIARLIKQTNKKILIIRKTLPSLRISTYIMWLELLGKYGLLNLFPEAVRKASTKTLDFSYNGNWIHFGSIDDPEKIKSTEWNYIWMEEANEFTYDDYQILRLRLSAPTTKFERNQLIMSFNPVDEYSWIKTMVVDRETDLEEIHSTYLDNPFLSQDYIQMLLDLKNQDANYWRIYGEGEWGRLENIIYTNWDIVDEFKEGLDEFYGLDFGYNNPCCLVKLGMRENEIWEKQLIYATKLTNPELIALMKECIPPEKRTCPIYADPQNPGAIEEIFNAGFNIHPANNDVREGIRAVKSFKIHITRDSIDGIKEKRGYAWKKDKNNNALEDPIKFNDHYVDAERYAIYTHMNQTIPGLFVIGGKEKIKEII